MFLDYAEEYIKDIRKAGSKPKGILTIQIILIMYLSKNTYDSTVLH